MMRPCAGAVAGAAVDAITIAEAAGQTGPITGFQQSLKEELAMAQTVADLVKPTTRRYLELTVSGAKADR